MTNVLQFTINFRKSYRESHCTLQLVCENGVLPQLYAGSSTENASEKFGAYIHSSLVNLPFIQPHKQKPNGVSSGVSNSSMSVTIRK
jgi:hypothetical protein